jgi:hypothetical protein
VDGLLKASVAEELTALAKEKLYLAIELASVRSFIPPIRGRSRAATAPPGSFVLFHL